MAREKGPLTLSAKVHHNIIFVTPRYGKVGFVELYIKKEISCNAKFFFLEAKIHSNLIFLIHKLHGNVRM